MARAAWASVEKAPRWRPSVVSDAVSLVVVAVSLAGCSSDVEVPSARSGEVLVLSSAETAALMKDGDTLTIDARPQQEYLAKRPVGMQNIPFTDRDLWEHRITTLDTSLPVAVYCDTTSCSAAAAQELSDAGFEFVYDLGGIEDWDPEHLTIKGPA